MKSDWNTVMTRWDVFRLLTQCLGAVLSRNRPALPQTAIPWPLLIEASEDHFTSPALGWCLRGDERVPHDVRQFFETFLELARERNGIILRGLEHALASLNSDEITPLLLKGTAALAEDLYPDAGMRIMSDIDLLVPAERLGDAARALERARFIPVRSPAPFDPTHHHLPVQVHLELHVGVELHHTPAPREFERLVNADAFWRNSRVVQWRHSRVRLPSPTDRVAHNVAHGQIVDGHYWRGTPRLRQLLELELLRARYAHDIDAVDLSTRFADAGYGDVLADTLVWATFLLNDPHSAHAAGPMRPELIRLQRLVEYPERQRWTVYRRLVARNSRRVLQNPRFFLNALRPRFWQTELDGIRRRLTVSRW
jgi:hypothetical protein